MEIPPPSGGRSHFPRISKFYNSSPDLALADHVLKIPMPATKHKTRSIKLSLSFLNILNGRGSSLWVMCGGLR